MSALPDSIEQVGLGLFELFLGDEHRHHGVTLVLFHALLDLTLEDLHQEALAVRPFADVLDHVLGSQHLVRDDVRKLSRDLPLSLDEDALDLEGPDLDRLAWAHK